MLCFHKLTGEYKNIKTLLKFFVLWESLNSFLNQFLLEKDESLGGRGDIIFCMLTFIYLCKEKIYNIIVFC